MTADRLAMTESLLKHIQQECVVLTSDWPHAIVALATRKRLFRMIFLLIVVMTLGLAAQVCTVPYHLQLWKNVSPNSNEGLKDHWRVLPVRALKRVLMRDSSLRNTVRQAETVAAHFNSLPIRNLQGIQVVPIF